MGETSKMPTFVDIYDELLNPVEPEYLIDGIIEDQTTGAIIGESGSGKTFVALSMVFAVATGTPWAGHTINRQGTTIYFAGEGRQGIRRRVNALQEHHKIKIPKGRFFLPKLRIEFDTNGVNQVEEAIDALALENCSPVLLVIDTLARALPSDADENSSKDMSAFINIVDRLRDKYGCVVIIVHHTGHSKSAKSRGRGSSSFRAAMDWEFLVDKGKNQLISTKMKDAEIPLPVSMKLINVSESAVVVFGGVVEVKIKLIRSEEFAVETLMETFKIVGNQKATTEEWRDQFYQKNYGSDAAKRKAFERARKSLFEKGAVILENDTYSLAGQTGQNETNSNCVPLVDSGTGQDTPL